MKSEDLLKKLESLKKELKQEKAFLAAAAQAATLYNYSREPEENIIRLQKEINALKAKCR